MKFVRLSVAFCWMLLFSASGVAGQQQYLHGHVPAAAAHLAPTGRLSAAQRLNLAIGLPLRHPDKLRDLLQRLYDPASPDYHQFLTPEEFTARFGPSDEDYEALRKFIDTNGLNVTALHSNRMLLDVNGTVADIERLLHVTLRLYSHPAEKRSFFAPDTEPSLDVSVPVLHVSGLDNFLLPRPMNLKASSATPEVGSGPGGAYVGNDFRAAYIPGAPLTGAGQVVGLLEFDGYFSGDVAAYRNLASLPEVPLKNVLLDGFNGAPGGNNTEVALDIDMATSMAPGLSAIIVYEGEVTDDILNRMATDNLAKQMSASWLYPIDAVSEQIFQQYAAQGQSFFNAAGDYDAYSGAVFTPADDPNITIVGGTTLSTSGPGGAWVSETVWNWGSGIGTGGGISTTYPIPWWQTNVNMAANHGSSTMRNLPDVAMTADNVWVLYDDGAAGNFGGTSCATPLWAAFTALINQQALANGLSTMGFINPAVYNAGLGSYYNLAFHDITNGNNTSPASPDNFYAVTGYDLCTGWGTPAGTNLINLLAPPDALRITPAAGFIASGGAGGPFTSAPQTFLLTNAGTNALNWAVGNAPWLATSPSSGTLQPGGAAATVIASLTAPASNLVAGTYTASLWFTNLGDNFAQSRLFTLNVLNPPFITNEPANVTVLAGAAAQFTVGATGGAPLSFQWRQNGTNLSDGGGISGSATGTLTIVNTTSTNAGSYTVVVSNAAGALTSAPPAVLTVMASPPVIVAQPAGQTVLAGATVNLAVSVLGSAPLSFQWQCNNTNLANGGAISGATSSNLVIDSVSGTNGGVYTVIITNTLGATSSAPAMLTVYAEAATQLLQNGGFETGNFSSWNLSGNSSLDAVSAGSLFAHSGLYGAEMGAAGSLGYISQTVPTTPGGAYLLSLWLDSPDGATPNEFLAGWNGYTIYDQTNLAAFGWSNFQFIVTATSSATTVEIGCRNDNSFFGLDDISLRPLLNPNAAPVITAQPASQTYVPTGASATLNVGAVGQAPLSYQWQSNNAPIAGATNATLAFARAAANQSAVYNVVVSNALGSTASSNAILAVLPGSATLVTFDDLVNTNFIVPAGYANLGWSNFYYLDSLLSAPNPSGYLAGMISQPNVAYNGDGAIASITNATPFAFLSAYMTAAWNDGLRLEVRGYASNRMVYDAAWTLVTESPALIDFNCVGVTNMEFISSGGTPASSSGGSGFQFVMDNASVLAQSLPPPPNDSCASAIVVTNDPYSNTQSTLGATSTGDPAPSCATNFTNGVWYAYTPPANGTLELDTTGTTYSNALAIFTGTCGSLIQVACGPGTMSVTGGTTYYILAGALGDANGTLVIHLAFSSPTIGPPLILSQPTNVTATVGNSATFSVAAEGAQPLSYTWMLNGAAIAGATSSSFTTNNVQLANSGSDFSCLVSNALGLTNSSMATLAVMAPGQLVQNGGFETGDFTDWTQSGNALNCSVTSDPYYVHSGEYGASLGPYGSMGYLTQTLPTAAGQIYLLSLWLDNPFGATNTESIFTVAWNGTTLFAQTNLPAILNWTNLQFQVPATTTNTVLQFGFRDDPYWLGLDDISVTPQRSILYNIGSSNSALTFNWSATLNSVYQLQSTTDLSPPQWTPVGGDITATNYIMTTSATIGQTNAQFFRIALVP